MGEKTRGWLGDRFRSTRRRLVVEKNRGAPRVLAIDLARERAPGSQPRWLDKSAF
jgi:hypothetical protein